MKQISTQTTSQLHIILKWYLVEIQVPVGKGQGHGFRVFRRKLQSLSVAVYGVVILILLVLLVALVVFCIIRVLPRQMTQTGMDSVTRFGKNKIADKNINNYIEIVQRTGEGLEQSSMLNDVKNILNNIETGDYHLIAKIYQKFGISQPVKGYKIILNITETVQPTRYLHLIA